MASASPQLLRSPQFPLKSPIHLISSLILVPPNLLLLLSDSKLFLGCYTPLLDTLQCHDTDLDSNSANHNSLNRFKGQRYLQIPL